MTRKHFEALAKALEAVGRFLGDGEDEIFAWEECCLAVANVCYDFNPNFDRTRSLQTCGVDTED